MKNLLILLILVLAGCSTNVLVQGRVPTPLVATAPLKVGVYYSPEFSHYRHEETIDNDGTYKIDFGAEDLRFFKKLFGTMFRSVVELKEMPANAQQIQAKGLDGVLVPEIRKYGFLTPQISGLNFYSASIRYHLKLYDRTGRQVADWGLVGYGKSEGSAFSADKALARATLQAIRDAGARIAIDIPADPAFQAWVRDSRSTPDAKPVAGTANAAPDGEKTGNDGANSSKSDAGNNPSVEGGD